MFETFSHFFTFFKGGSRGQHKVPGCYKFRFSIIMASDSSREKRKPSCELNPHQPPVFKQLIIKFVQALCKDDREAFRFWCNELIPTTELNINVENDGNIFKLIELLQEHNHLSCDNLSLLKKFLVSVNRCDLLIVLEKTELNIVVRKIFEQYKLFHGGNDHSGGTSFHAEVSALLVSTREKFQELISQVLKHVHEIDDDEFFMPFLDGVIHEYLSAECTWSQVTAVMVVLAELPTEDSQSSIELLAEKMHKLGGIKGFKVFVKEKLNLKSYDYALTSMQEVKKCLEIIGHQVDKNDIR